MARDYTKYSLNGTGKYSKSKLALAIIKQFISDVPDANLEEIQSSFILDEKPSGFISELKDIKDQKRYTNEILIDCDGREFMVSNQWNVEGIDELILSADIQGMKVEKINNDHSDEDAIVENPTPLSIRMIVRDSEDPKRIDDCGFIDLFINDIKFDTTLPISMIRISDFKNRIFNSDKHVNTIRTILNGHNIDFNKVPQLWISKLGDIDLTCALKLFFEEDDTQENFVNEILELKEYDLDNYYESDGVYSVETIMESL